MVINPTLGPCPECGSTNFNADVVLNHQLSVTESGEIRSIDRAEGDLESFASVFCSECDCALIEDFDWVNEPAPTRS